MVPKHAQCVSKSLDFRTKGRVSCRDGWWRIRVRVSGLERPLDPLLARERETQVPTPWWELQRHLTEETGWGPRGDYSFLPRWQGQGRGRTTTGKKRESVGKGSANPREALRTLTKGRGRVRDDAHRLGLAGSANPSSSLGGSNGRRQRLFHGPLGFQTKTSTQGAIVAMETTRNQGGRFRVQPHISERGWAIV